MTGAPQVSESAEALPFADDFADDEFADWILDNRTRVANDTDWRERLLTAAPNADGVRKVLPNVANAMTILRYHPEWRGVIAHDSFGDVVLKKKDPPWDPGITPIENLTGEWLDEDTTRVQAWLERNELLHIGHETLEKAVLTVAATEAFHPVRDYLASLKWDGTPRLLRVLATYFGAADNEYTQGVGKRWMISAVARIFKPGCQADCALILEGEQGIGKTTAMRALVKDPKWYSDTGITIGDKDSYQNLRSVWIYGLDELDSLRRSEITRTKNFISTQSDRYRASYARRAKDYPRQCVFCGTTNETEYLADKTGNRRFWPIKVVRKIDVEAVRRDRDQLWAESMVCFKAGQPWHIDTPELRELCNDEAESRTSVDPWVSKVSSWLTCPTMWDSLRPYDVAQGLLTSDVLAHALGMRHSDMKKTDEMRIAQVLRELGYVLGKQRREGGRRVRRYTLPQGVTTSSPVTTYSI